MALALASPPVIPCHPFPESYFCAIAQAISHAWLEICADGLEDSLDEDTTTNQLHAKLIDMLDETTSQVPLFTCKYFETPGRDAKHSNCDATSIDQMPDISFRISGDLGIPHKHKAIFVECKVLDENRGVNLYCKYGIKRFVDGEYAYRMPHAIMIAYVANRSYSMPASLDDYFANSSAPCAKSCSPTGASAVRRDIPCHEDVFITTHPRAFSGAPGAIELNHLWLAVPEKC